VSVPVDAPVTGLTQPLDAALPDGAVRHLPRLAPSLADQVSDGVLNLLLVEDNAINMALAKALLGRMGHRVTTVANGQEAIDVLVKETFDAVLMDCQMPVLDGFEATRRIRSGEAGVLQPTIRIIAMTANAMVGDKERCEACGMDDYVAKPINVALLKAALARVPPR
jgi:CheY-like chemotaxis protein